MRGINVLQIEKVFDVACTLIDVMSCVPIDSTEFELGPLDYLTQLINLLSTLRGGETRYMPLVVIKIQETLPAIAPTIIQSLDLETPDARVRDVQVRQSSSSSSASSPLSSPPLMQYYPLA